MTFRIGQKVVCIEDRWGNPDYKMPPVPMPTRGGIYTIREMEPGTCGTLGEVQLGLRFFEFAYPLTPSGFEISFAARCFRPLVDKKTDISIFTKMLTPQKEVVS